jgi:hypothetical protein
MFASLKLRNCESLPGIGSRKPSILGVFAVPCCVCVLVVTSWGCGASAVDREVRVHRAQQRLSRRAVLAMGPETLHLTAGDIVTVPVQLRIAEGFYVVAPKSQNQDLMPLWIAVPKAGIAMTKDVLWPSATLVEMASRSRPLLAYAGTVTVNIRLQVSAGVPPGERLLVLPVHYQQCTVRGCEVPRDQYVRVQMVVLPRR